MTKSPSRANVFFLFTWSDLIEWNLFRGSIAPVRSRVGPTDEKSLNEPAAHTAKALKF